MKLRKNQQGVALITVLVIVALLTPLLTKLMVSQQLLIQRTAIASHFNTSVMYALALEAFGRHYLDDTNLKRKESTGFDEGWSRPIILPVDGGSMGGSLTDMQGLYNLNNFQAQKDDSYKIHFWKLCKLLEIEEKEARKLVQALEDWMDKDDKTEAPSGAEDLDYAGLDLPYRTSKRMLVSSSELFLLRDVKPDTIEKLLPFVTALPSTGTKININTAPKMVLYSLFPDNAQSIIDLFIQERKSVKKNTSFSFRDIETFAKDYQTNVGEEISAETLSIIGVNSRYFLAKIKAKFGKSVVQLNSLLFSGKMEEEKSQVLLRSFGSL